MFFAAWRAARRKAQFLFWNIVRGGMNLGYYSLILEKRYREFCEVYQEKGHLYKENPQSR